MMCSGGLKAIGLGMAFMIGVVGCATLTDSAEQYRAGVRAIADGQTYFALTYLRGVALRDPKSPYAAASLFAIGENAYDGEDYFNAIKLLSSYIRQYPKDRGVVFAKLIIYEIITTYKDQAALDEPEQALAKEIRKELFSQPIFFVFYDKKSPRSYRSLFKHAYTVYDYVDRIKVFRDDKIFLELTP
jgi:hypothetical protein